MDDGKDVKKYCYEETNDFRLGTDSENVEYNPNGCLYLGIGSSNQDHVRLFPENKNWFQTDIKRMSRGWEITYQIPVSFLRLFFPDFIPASGKKMSANFYKCGELTMQRHYLALNRITSEQPNFHRPCDFGILEFQ